MPVEHLRPGESNSGMGCKLLASNYNTALIASMANLNGVNQYFSTAPAPFEFTSDFSVSMWAKADVQVPYGRIIDCSYFGGAAPAGRGGWFIGFDSTNLRYEFRLDDVGSDGGCVTDPIELGEWVNIVATYNKTTETALVYTSGSLDDSMATSGTLEYSNVSLLGVGARLNSNAGPVVADIFNGGIGFGNIWDRVITPAEAVTINNLGVATCYDSMPAGLLTGLISSWHIGKFTNHIGDEKIDMMGGNNLTDTGSILFDATGLTVECT